MNVSSLSRAPAAEPRQGGDGYLLRTEADLAKLASYAIDKSAALGAAQAGAIVSEAGGINIQVANHAVETATRDGDQSLVVTVHQNGRTGSATTQALSREAIDKAVEQALAMATQLEPDEDAGLADRDALAWATPDVPLFAPSGSSAADLIQAALALEAAALGEATGDKVRVTQAGAASRDSRWALATSQGFCRTGGASMQSLWCQVIAERDKAMVQDHWMSVDRQYKGLDPESVVGRRAAQRALTRLGATTLSTRRAPVLIDATVAASLVRDLCAQLGGQAQYRRMTFLPDALGQTIAAPHLSLTEDPFEPFGLASAAFDDEGVAGKRRQVVEDGLVKGLFLGSRMARKLGLSSTGNAGGMRNLTLTSRDTRPGDDLDSMLRKLGTGLWLTRFMGGGVNPTTGAYSRAASGFWVENGQVVGPVEGFTVAGNLQAMLQAIIAVGADVHRSGGVRTGSVLLPDLQIAGR